MYINISSEVLQYGIHIGFLLARLEWIWGSEFEEAQKELAPSKDEILNLLSVYNINSYFPYPNRGRTHVL